MKGTKAEALDRWAAAQGRACVRFDYSGHGESGGDFTDGTIGRWLEESARGLSRSSPRARRCVVGSSMGGWLALLLARELAQRRKAAPRRIAGMVLIAPAVDFTEELMWKQFPADDQARDRGRRASWHAAVAIFAKRPIRSPAA